ncbi:tetraacyldisaccharide 4'-kinase [Shewanella maritima]|uniref:Tetraacyldisaccharide 4'-kinase n=1 Tax=Shewanella maritima TaxID=2520507 RepID=A0A411PLJ2_9GAMM|nr:tetraacyldisaccharide 4'-kinase [Shewanella maritima]QBF84387.1 tetraacyldisaccharide 4'-kinase [Shewanella maritima]
MQNWVNKIWYQGHWAKWLLVPLSLIFWFISIIRRSLFRLGLKQQTRVSVPVIVVGNITAGGSGKTPTVIHLIELLRANGYKPGVVSRGYGGSASGVMLVEPSSEPSLVGDEPALIAMRTKAPMAVGSKRVQAAKLLLANHDVDVIISDDGMQHYALARDIEIALVDGDRRYGNEWLIPAGPLREGTSRLESVDFIINNGGPAQDGEALMTLAPLKPAAVVSLAANMPKNVQAECFDKQQPICAIAGIGNPQRFFDSLVNQGFNLTRTQAFDDHQAYSAEQLQGFSQDTALLMTEKDAVKCRAFAQQHWWYLPVNAKLTAEFDQALLSRLQQAVDKIKEA